MGFVGFHNRFDDNTFPFYPSFPFFHFSSAQKFMIKDMDKDSDEVEEEDEGQDKGGCKKGPFSRTCLLRPRSPPPVHMFYKKGLFFCNHS